MFELLQIRRLKARNNCNIELIRGFPGLLTVNLVYNLTIYDSKRCFKQEKTVIQGFPGLLSYILGNLFWG